MLTKGRISLMNFSTEFSLDHLIRILLVLAMMFIALGVSSLITKRIFKHHMKSGNTRFGTIIRVLGSCTKVLIVFIFAMWILAILGFNVRSFVAGLGLVSAVIGLALQDTLKDYMMGLHIIFDESMDISSIVTINGHTGIVESFTLRTTKLYDFDLMGTVYICNRDITTIEEGFPCFDIPVNVSQNNDADKVTEVFKALPEKLEKTVASVDRSSYVGIKDFVNDGTLHAIRVWGDMKSKPIIKRACNAVIARELSEAGIELVKYEKM